MCYNMPSFNATIHRCFPDEALRERKRLLLFPWCPIHLSLSFHNIHLLSFQFQFVFITQIPSIFHNRAISCDNRNTCIVQWNAVFVYFYFFSFLSAIMWSNFSHEERYDNIFFCWIACLMFGKNILLKNNQAHQEHNNFTYITLK